jgi:hypothetical protein
LAACLAQHDSESVRFNYCENTGTAQLHNNEEPVCTEKKENMQQASKFITPLSQNIKAEVAG